MNCWSMAQEPSIYFISFHLIIKVLIIFKRLNKLLNHIISKHFFLSFYESQMNFSNARCAIFMKKLYIQSDMCRHGSGCRFEHPKICHKFRSFGLKLHNANTKCENKKCMLTFKSRCLPGSRHRYYRGWLPFVCLFCLSRQQTFQNKLGLSNPVNLNAKEKRAGSIVYWMGILYHIMIGVYLKINS